nr:ABC transporter substrate-binding protein [uncultured Roseococcus sp.]
MTNFPAIGRRTMLGGLVAAAALPARAANGPRHLTLAAIAAPTALDPHFYNSPTNNQALRQIYDTLTVEDVHGQLQPGLATSWRNVSPLVWEFDLRSGVRFHDGTPLVPDDVAFSVARVPQVPNSAGPFLSFINSIERVEATGDTSLRIVTNRPNPFLLRDLGSIFILSRRLHENGATADFNTGRLAVGTGPYRYTGFTLGERLELAGNDAYWGGRPDWDTVSIRYVSNGGARIAGLLAGDFDLVDGIPAQDVARLSAQPNLSVAGLNSAHSAYLFPDTDRDEAPFVTDRAGRPLGRNPLKDVRVRQALSLAIHRAGLVDRLLQGQGQVADQFAPLAAPDRLPGLPPLPTDLARARALLSEAGYPNGFNLTIHGPSGYFNGDAAVLAGIAQGFTRISVQTTAETLPLSVFFTRATRREFALFLSTYGSTSGVDLLRQIVATRRTEERTGAFNRQHYANPDVDVPLTAALREMDDERRLALSRQAQQALLNDLGVLPLFYVRYNWAGRRDKVRYEPGNAYGHTNVNYARSAA